MTGSRALRLLALMLAAAQLCACAHAPAPVDEGRAGGPPALSSLPNLPPGCSGETQRTHQGILVVRGVLDSTMPPSPDDHSYESLQAWVGGAVAHWLETRRKGVEEARFEFRLSDGSSAGEAIVAHAVVGLVYEDTAASLERIPPPLELAEEPEIAEMFGDIMRSHARPFLSSALVEFRECVDIAYDGPEDMRHWAQFCQVRFERLRELINSAQSAVSLNRPQ